MSSAGCLYTGHKLSSRYFATLLRLSRMTCVSGLVLCCFCIGLTEGCTTSQEREFSYLQQQYTSYSSYPFILNHESVLHRGPLYVQISEIVSSSTHGWVANGWSIRVCSQQWLRTPRVIIRWRNYGVRHLKPLSLFYRAFAAHFLELSSKLLCLCLGQCLLDDAWCTLHQLLGLLQT